MAGGKKTKGGPDTRVELAPFNPIGVHIQEEELGVIVTLVPPNVAIPPTKVLVQMRNQQNLRFTLDGSAPTPAFGFRLTAGRDPIMITLGPDTVVQFIEEAAGAILEYVWGQ